MTMTTRHAANMTRAFMEMTYRDVVSKFASLEGAVTIRCKATGWYSKTTEDIGPAVFIPGTRPDRVLLVAHYDTVWGRPAKLRQRGYLFESARDKEGIGADDRAGCAALWALRNSGHSLLIVPEEEAGCLGSCYIAESRKALKTIGKHAYAIQFDRRGSHDLVYYDCDNAAFCDMLEDNMPGYSTAGGSFSDIAELCPAMGIAGVNISIGFRAEHTARETLDLLDFLRTVENVRAMLKKECKAFKYVTRWHYKAKTKGKGKGKKSSTATYGYKNDPEWQEVLDGVPQDLIERQWWCDDCAQVFFDGEILDPTDPTCPVCNCRIVDISDCSRASSPVFTPAPKDMIDKLIEAEQEGDEPDYMRD